MASLTSYAVEASAEVARIDALLRRARSGDPAALQEALEIKALLDSSLGAARPARRPARRDPDAPRKRAAWLGPELTAGACRAARALVKWTVRDLAERAGVCVATITAVENGHAFQLATELKIKAAFAGVGVTLVEGPGSGVRLAAPGPG